MANLHPKEFFEMAKPKVTIDPIVQAAMDAHGDCAPFKAGGKLYVFRPLTLDEFEDFQVRAGKKDAEPGAMNRECCQKALVHPELEDLKKLFELKPGFASLASTAIMQLSIADVEVVAKKG
jgi:hypothetical protein